MVNTLIRSLLIVAAILLLTDRADAQCTGQPDANTVCAGPPSGAPGLPFFRSLTPADVPQAGGVVIQNNETPVNGSQAGRIFYNANGYFSDFVPGGDCTFTAPNFICTKTNGTTFAASATVNTRDASNINAGLLGNARLTTGFVVAGTGLTGGNLAGGGTIAADIATATNFWGATSNKLLAANSVFTGETAITYSATPTLDFNMFINASITLTGNITSITASNMKAGQAGMIRLIQDGTGNRTIPITFASSFHCPGGCNYVLSTAAASVDAIPYFCVSSSYCIGGPLIKDVK